MRQTLAHSGSLWLSDDRDDDHDEDHDDEHLAGLQEAERLDRFDEGPGSFTQSQDRPPS